jgi:hypothetical protein
MLAEVFGPDIIYVLLLLISLGLVVWAIVDAARQPALSSGARAGWIISLVVGTFLFGVVGLVIALVYLIGVRPRLMRSN